MSAISSQPSNKNFLSPLGFKFIIKKTPNINWFVQSVNLPGLTIPSANVSTPFVNLPFTGDQMRFDHLEVTFRVDEDMKNYLEIYNWMVSMGFPETFEEYKGPGPGLHKLNHEQLYSDASLIIHDSKMNPNVEITFRDVFPIQLSELKFDTTLPDVSYVQSTAIFTYQRFKINTL